MSQKENKNINELLMDDNEDEVSQNVIFESIPDEAIKAIKIPPKKAKIEDDVQSYGSLEDMFS